MRTNRMRPLVIVTAKLIPRFFYVLPRVVGIVKCAEFLQHFVYALERALEHSIVGANAFPQRLYVLKCALEAGIVGVLLRRYVITTEAEADIEARRLCLQ